jgi:hypothetical protein
MRIFATLCLFLCLMSNAGIASTGVRMLARTGPWEAYHTIADDGEGICGISQFSNGLGLLIKINQSRMTMVHLTKDGWSVPPDARMSVSFLVDGKPIVRLPFTGTDHRYMIGSRLSPEQSAALITPFALGRRMEIHFLTGNEGFWTVPLDGTYQITQAFFRCASTMLGSRQPYDDAATNNQSQPF